MKTLLQKCLESGADPHLAMICHRATAVDYKLTPPVEMLNFRKCKTNLHAKSRHLMETLQARQEMSSR